MFPAALVASSRLDLQGTIKISGPNRLDKMKFVVTKAENSPPYDLSSQEKEI